MRQTVTVKGAGGLKRRAAKALKLKNIDRLTIDGLSSTGPAV